MKEIKQGRNCSCFHRLFFKAVGYCKVFDLHRLDETALPAKIKEMMVNGYYPPRAAISRSF
jgi:hypothetical protein